MCPLTKKPGELWWPLRKGTTHIYVSYGRNYGSTLFATNVEMQEGPPVTIRLDLEKNLRTKSKTAGTYIDARNLADGRIDTLIEVAFTDAQIAERLREHVNADDQASPWRLIVNLKGKHLFPVEPEFRSTDQLILRIA